MNRPPLPPRPDVCLILEGTYPYVSGGVSTWVHQMITALPAVRFSVFYIGSDEAARAHVKYALPSNVVSLDALDLHDEHGGERRTSRAAAGGSCARLHELLRRLLADDESAEAEAASLTRIAEEVISLSRRVSFGAFWNDRGTWDLVSECYEAHAAGESFLDFFWSVRSLLEPVWRLLAAAVRLPAAPVFHSLCTGYSGFLAGVAAHRTGGLFLLSEHGIYVRERLAELQRARWIYDPPVLRPALRSEPALLRRLWMAFFLMLGRHAYASAHHITSLFGRNAAAQSGFGADPRKIEVIPNGIRVDDFAAVRAKRAARPRGRTVGFMGRIVPIKDVKTLLKCARLVAAELADARFLIVGPEDEDAAYAAECHLLCTQLGLGAHVTFTGPRDAIDVLPDLDLMLLTSVSEGLPFVVLEAFAAGLPVVSTDVGSCRELIEGQPGLDREHGAAGLVAPVGDAGALAGAIVRILTDSSLADQMGRAGLARAAANYNQDHVVARYAALYSGRREEFRAFTANAAPPAAATPVPA